MKKYIIRMLTYGFVLFLILSFPVNKYDVTVFSYLKKVNEVISSKNSTVDNEIYEAIVIKPRGVTRVIHLIYTLILNGEIKQRNKISYQGAYSNTDDSTHVYFTDEYEPYKNSSIGLISDESSLFTIPIYNAYKNLDSIINYKGFTLLFDDETNCIGDYPQYARYNKINDLVIKNNNDFLNFIENNQLPNAILTSIDGQKVKAHLVDNDGKYQLCPNLLFIYTVDKNNFNIKNSLFYSGTSGQLMQGISLYLEANNLNLKDDIKIAGTGTLNNSGNVIKIFSINQKIKAASKKGINYFFLPEDNYKDANAYIVNNNLDITLISVSNFDEAIAKVTSQFIAY